MTRPGYRTSAQKAGKSAGQRQRRMARDRKRQNREANVYATSVKSSIVKESRYDNDELAVYGVYEQDGEWVLTAMAIQRNVEKLVSDRQGATKSESKDRSVVTPTRGSLDPENGVEISRFNTKKSALSEVRANSSTRVGTGRYVVKLSDWKKSINTHKVDRDKFREFCTSSSVSRVR